MEEFDQETLKQRQMLIVDQHRGIYPVYEAFYIHSILYAADRSNSAFQRFDDAHSSQASAARVVATVQEALTHAGALSRFFWPVKNGEQLAQARGRRLREAFSVDDNSPLKQRNLRNAFEHFDEGLDRFLLVDRSGYFFPSPMVDDHTLADTPIGHIFKLVDLKQGVCVILGEKFEFRPIREEVRRILSRALQMDKAGARL